LADPAPAGGKAAICCWSVLRSAAAASAAAVAAGEGGVDTANSFETGGGGEAADCEASFCWIAGEGADAARCC
jgi:hypothetical protein